jgi:ribonuclease T2
MGGEEGIERAEGEWAQSEVGEGVEEVWERAVRSSSLKLPVKEIGLMREWNTAGRYISTLATSCGTGSSGEQVCLSPALSAKEGGKS